MTHPRDKRHREVIGAAKRFRRSAGRLSPPKNERQCRLPQLVGLDDTGRPCSCWMCKRPRYERSQVKKAALFFNSEAAG